MAARSRYTLRWSLVILLFTQHASRILLLSLSFLRPFVQVLAVLVLAVAANACQYQKLLNSDDNERKFQAAKQYFEQGDYQKAQPLLNDLLSFTRGTDRAEDVRYYYAYSEYHLGNYVTAAYYFKLLHEVYTYSERSEEAYYMHAYCKYLQSPPIELDQKATYQAIDALQQFANRYPSSDRIDEVNNYIDKLRNKLRKKDTRQARLWYKIYDYRAAAFSLKDLLKEYPDHPQKQSLEFLLVDARAQLALKSVAKKKEERVLDALRQIRQFNDAFPTSRYNQQVSSLKNELTESLNQIRASTNG